MSAERKEGKREMRRKDQKIRKTMCMLDKTDGTIVIFFVDLLRRLIFFPFFFFSFICSILTRFFPRAIAVVAYSRVDTPLYTYVFLRVCV